MHSQNVENYALFGTTTEDDGLRISLSEGFEELFQSGDSFFLFIFKKRKFRNLEAAIIKIQAKLANDGRASFKTQEKGLSGVSPAEPW